MRVSWHCRGRASLLAMIAVCSVVGCGDKLGRVSATGIVLVDEEPTEGVQVSFQRTGDEKGPPAYAVTGVDGKFELITSGQPGAVPGEYIVMLVKNEEPKLPANAPPGMTFAEYAIEHGISFQSLINPKYSHPKSSPLKATITEDAEKNHFEFKIEGNRKQKATKRR